MSSGLFHIIDMDDGPDSGGGAALAKLLTQNDIPHCCWTNSKTSSGWDHSAQVRAVDDAGLVHAIENANSDDRFVLGTSGAKDWLNQIRRRFEVEFPEHLSSLVDMPRGHETLEIAQECGLLPVDHEVLSSVSPRTAYACLMAGGWIVSASGGVFAVLDDGDGWYLGNKLFRKGAQDLVLIPREGRMLFLACHYFVDGEPRHGTFSRVDSIRPSGRPALIRTVAGKTWTKATSDISSLDFESGFLQSLWAFSPGEKRARFFHCQAVPPAWLQIDATGYADAIKNSKKQYQQTNSGLYYADAPIDLAIHPKTLLERSIL